MVIWLDKGITLAVSKKKKKKIQNRKTQTLSCGDFVRQVIKNWDYSLWAEWALLSKGKDVKELTCRVTKDKRQ